MIISKNFKSTLSKIADKLIDRNLIYARDYADDNLALITENGIENKLRRIKKRESDEDFETRIELTHFVNASLSNHILSEIYGLFNISTSKTLEYSNDEDNSKYLKFHESIEMFHDGKGIDSYIQGKLIDLATIDPNGFVLINKYDDNGIERAFPIFINSHDVFNVVKEYGDLVQLSFISSYTNEEGKELLRYYIYEKGVVYQLDEVKVNVSISDNKFLEIEEIETGELIRLKDKIYFVTVIETGIDEIPAFQVGYIYDKKNNCETYATFLEPAKTWLNKLVNAASELDVTLVKHVFPRLFGYERACKGDRSKGLICDGGKIKGTNDTCHNCNGTGILSPYSSLDSIVLELPSRPEDLHDLSKLVHTEGTDIELIKFMVETLENSMEQAEISIYGVSTLEKGKVVKTATEKILEREKIATALKTTANAISYWWVSLHYYSALITGNEQGLKIEHKFPKDLRVRNESELLEELKLLKDSGADSTLIAEVQDELAQKRLEDSPDRLKRYNVYNEHKPFDGDSIDSVRWKITQGLVSKRDEILWANYQDIIQSVEQENKEFYELDFDQRQSLIDEKLEIYIASINNEPSQIDEI